MFGKKKVASFEARVSIPEGANSAPYSQLTTRNSKLRRSRRGVLLLVVLSLLVLFMMIGTAFIVSSKQFEKGAKASQRAALQASDVAAHSDLLDEVLMQLVRDTNAPNSSLRYHSLLEDMYGLDGWRSQIPPASTPLAMLIAPLDPQTALKPNPAPTETLQYTVRWPDNGVAGPNNRPNVTGNQILEFDVVKFNRLYEEPHEPHTGGGPPLPHTAAEFSPLDDAYAGQVVTFTSGAARGVSARILGSRFTQASGGNWLTLRVQAFKLAGGSQLPVDPAMLQLTLAGARFLVNGRPFNGTGAGFNAAATTGPRSNLEEPFRAMVDQNPAMSFPVALMPNSAFFGASAGTTGNSPFLPMDELPPNYFLTDQDVAMVGAYPAALQRQMALRFKQMIGWNGRGGGNESYDAPDFQNMPLAMIPSSQTALQETSWTDPNNAPPPDLGTTVLPSFHRPELIYYWAFQSPFAPQTTQPDVRSSTLGQVANVGMLRKILLRPNWWDHPNFTGSNPEFAAATSQTRVDNRLARMVYGPWDVDNDNDGIRDSIWIDFGAPVMIGPEGKLVRPLAAILCIDLDGRPNVNVAGSLDLAAASGNNPDWTMSMFKAPPNYRGVAGGPANGSATAVSSEILPRGMGASPADISLAPVIGNSDFKSMLLGIPGGWPGRYGPNLHPGVVGFDVMAQINRLGWADRTDQRSSIGSPLDVNCRYATGVNIFGQPVFEALEVSSPSTWSLRSETPLELDVSQDGMRGMVAGASDMPFSVAELERTLRMYDADAGALPRRLYDLAKLFSEPWNRLRITTDSNDLPVPNMQTPPELLFRSTNNPGLMLDANVRPPQTIGELVEARVRHRLATQQVAGVTRFGGALDGSPVDPNTAAGRVRRIVGQILAPELAAGMRLDLNRPLGNGRDDNNNGVVDEPGEWDLNNNGQLDANEGELVWDPAMAALPSTASFRTAQFTPLDVNGDGVINEIDALQQRQLLARHLYVLALTLTAPHDYDPGPQTGGQNPTLAARADHQALARRLAQWAVNIVDFRDADNIMTPFEYDMNPFDGWDVDGDFRTVADHDPDGSLNVNAQGIPQGFDSGDETIVWGAERPELVMTETLAWHDRRTDDSGQAEAYPPEDGPDQLYGHGNPGKEEWDFDQLVRPRGALFVELYNPWPTNPSANADTHRLQNSAGQIVDAGVDLARTHDGTRTGAPVWRLAIYKRGDIELNVANQWDPDHPNRMLRPDYQNLMDRSVYFTDFDPGEVGGQMNWDADGTAFFSYTDPGNPQRSAVPSVRPGRYLVVGPGEPTNSPGVFEAKLGDRKGSRNTNDPANLNAPHRRIELNASGNVASTVKMMDAVDAGQQAFQDPTEQYLVQAPSESNGVTEQAYPGDNSRCVTDVAVINRATASVDEARNNVSQGDAIPRGLSISEPAEGYPYKFQGAEWDEDDQIYKSAQGAPMAIDIPLDGPIGGEGSMTLQRLDRARWPSYLDRRDPQTGRRIPVDQVLTRISTSANENQGNTYSCIYLQRLANPLLPWNPLPGRQGYNPNRQVNPYLTVDSHGANLTVFNSRGNPNNGEEEDGTPASAPRNLLVSHERGYVVNQRGGDIIPEVFSTEPHSPPPGTPRDPNSVRPKRNFYATADLRARNSYWFNAVPFHTLGFLNRAYFDANAQRVGGPAGDNEAKKVKPRKPFSWLTWNNRPYVSGNELLLAPRSRSSKILRDFSTAENAQGAPALASPYSTELDPTPGSNANANASLPFQHLENYFYTGLMTSTTHGVPRNLSRVLEYVHAPSLFAGTQTWLNPQTMAVTAAERAGGLHPDDPRHNHQAPFNAVSQQRDPGRMNLNTIYSREVWSCLFHGNPDPGNPGNRVHAGPPYEGGISFAGSRRGVAGGVLDLNANIPTFFGNPFRSQEAGDLVPLLSMVQPDSIDATLYRRSPPGSGNPTLFIAETKSNYDYADRNAYFRYQPMSRLGSMITTRSNVYAVWVTIGFFEADEIQDPSRMANDDPQRPLMTTIVQRFSNGSNQLEQARNNPLFNRVYPEGVMLGKEVGIDTGDVKRLRGFYILDRSIPAGFDPGKNTNVEKVIRLKRQIE